MHSTDSNIELTVRDLSRRADQVCGMECLCVLSESESARRPSHGGKPPVEGAPEDDTDGSLLLLIAGGNEAAMTLLFERHARLVYGIALRVVRDATQAEDVLQEVFMQIWRKPHSLNSAGGRFVPFLAIITRNRAIDTLRTRRPGQFPEDYDVASRFDLALDSEKRLMLNRVRNEAELLPTEQKLVLDLAFFEGLTHAEIAARTNMPLGTVKTRIRAALKTLRGTFAI